MHSYVIHYMKEKKLGGGASGWGQGQSQGTALKRRRKKNYTGAQRYTIAKLSAGPILQHDSAGYQSDIKIVQISTQKISPPANEAPLSTSKLVCDTSTHTSSYTCRSEPTHSA